MTRARVLVVGSAPAKDLLTAIVERVTSRGAEVRFHIGALADLRQSAIVKSADVLVVADSECTEDDIAGAQRLRAIVSPVLGVEGIDERAATDSTVLVVRGHVPENYESMAEATIMLLLAALYDLPRKISDFASGVTRPKAELRSRMLKGKTIGIVGFGNVSRALIGRLAGWNVEVLVHTRGIGMACPGIQFVSLPELLRRSDAIALLCNLNDHSRKLLNTASLSQVKKGAVIVNTARGGLIDERALVESVRTGAIGYVALDVFEKEPVGADSPLRDLGDAILTAHCVGHTIESIEAIRATAVSNVMEVLRGRAPLPVRNPQILTQWTQKWRGSCLV
jgi:phosphoglycerate dehydrogenase-like enzyme